MIQFKPIRILYIFYYLKKEDARQRNTFIHHVYKTHGISKPRLWVQMIRDSLLYNVSLIEYFLFHFYALDRSEKAKWVGTGTTYEHQKKMNPHPQRQVLSNKFRFYKVYRPFIKHTMVSVGQLSRDARLTIPLLTSPSGKVVFKPSDGQCGRGIQVIDTDILTADSLLERLIDSGNDIAEEYVQQHDDLNALSPSGLNTVRIITQLDGNDVGTSKDVGTSTDLGTSKDVGTDTSKVRILGARLRITVNSPVDNLAAGNIAVPIDLETGKVCGPGVYSDITKQDETHHPVTGIKLEGFQVPFWQECVEMAVQAALHDTRNRSIGWDIAVTNDGPDLIEGNHDWCRLLWQLPVKKGLMSELTR